MIRLQLTRAQQIEASEGYITLTVSEVRQLRGAFGGRPRASERCPCGCGLTVAQGRRRHPAKVRAASAE